uniref:Uncharacterized protein n=1 Tax=Candidatus Kentrum sp. MB TaxID=2138164 RepID=A0A450XDW4_9GAMM|nr:MAG: hypothetical protein BECKMB1821G_GA0114241_10286 [Candidatus Kentron sp. MB]VFK32018.1 MAG: hypothetical protein BECKMB1821I_GA0114274_10295 [Candidatus Kentron sp. MB]VFK75678.1 MAG: hypothetical protein BECKMB1821H_GA0114242_102843 [Candidatus Kentron sp. MB]
METVMLRIFITLDDERFFASFEMTSRAVFCYSEAKGGI